MHDDVDLGQHAAEAAAAQQQVEDEADEDERHRRHGAHDRPAPGVGPPAEEPRGTDEQHDDGPRVADVRVVRVEADEGVAVGEVQQQLSADGDQGQQAEHEAVDGHGPRELHGTSLGAPPRREAVPCRSRRPRPRPSRHPHAVRPRAGPGGCEAGRHDTRRLRVLLGAAPGVGKTYTMLEEGARLRAEGKDVVVAVVETHGRAATAAVLGDLEVVPRRRHRAPRGRARRDGPRGGARPAPRSSPSSTSSPTPTRPGSPHEKRWQDVEALLDAGIDVVSTVNVQHVESLNDVVEQITGAAQRETVPDARAARAPTRSRSSTSRRRRSATGSPRATSTRPPGSTPRCRTTSGSATSRRCASSPCSGSPTRSTAPCKAYRVEHGIDSTWEARERVVVALTGGAGGRDADPPRRPHRGPRRPAASWSPCTSAARTASGRAHPGALAAQRALVEKLGGTLPPGRRRRRAARARRLRPGGRTPPSS